MHTALSITLFLAVCLGTGIPLSGQNPCDQPPVFQSGPQLSCAGADRTYTLTDVPGVSFYRWTLDGHEIEFSPDPSVDILWAGNATYTLCAETWCAGGLVSPPACIDVTVYELLVEPEPIFLCPNDKTWNGLSPGSHTFFFTTPDGCDSTVILRIEPISASLVSIQSIPAKQKTALPKLVPTGIPPGLTPEFTWTGPNGYVSTQMSIHPPAEGEYCLEIRFPFQSDPAQSCSIHLCQVVDFPEPPETNDTPGEADPDGSDGMKPWIYPQPTSDQFCIAWPQADLHNATWTLYNRWGSLVQQGKLDHGCDALLPLAPDVYVLVLVLENGTLWSTPLTVQ